MSAPSSAFLAITLTIDEVDRASAGAVYHQYKRPFLDSVPGAQSKQLLVRDEDVQVLHGFASVGEARSYLDSSVFVEVVADLKPLLKEDPDVRIYDVSSR